MKKRVRIAAVVAGLAALSVAITLPAGAATAGHAVVIGGGTIAPALPATGCTAGPSSHTFTNTVIRYAGVVGTTPAAGSVNGNSSGSGSSFLCSNGDSIIESHGSGTYTGTGSDTLNGLVSVSCPYQYYRVLASVDVIATCTFSGGVNGTATLACQLAFEGTNLPVSQYLLQGTCIGAGA